MADVMKVYVKLSDQGQKVLRSLAILSEAHFDLELTPVVKMILMQAVDDLDTDFVAMPLESLYYIICCRALLTENHDQFVLIEQERRTHYYHSLEELVSDGLVVGRSLYTSIENRGAAIAIDSHAIENYVHTGIVQYLTEGDSSSASVQS